jgi:carbamoyltransferase
MIGHRVESLFAELGAGRTPPVSYCDHHMGHAAAAFYPSPFDHSAIVTADGLGEWATATVGHGSGHRIELVEELRYPDSLGLLYSFVTHYCGFRPNNDEYKVMGLAAFGEPRFREGLDQLATVLGDGSIAVRAARVGWYSAGATRKQRLHDVLGGPPRSTDAPVTRREADLAASVQQLTEEALLGMAAHAHELTGEPHLCLAGGVAFNSVANGRVVRESPFSKVWIQPAAGDAGSAIGAALHLWHQVHGRHRLPSEPDAMAGAFLGPRVLPDEVDRWVDEGGIRSTRLDRDALAAHVAGRLAGGAVVGWFQGRMEFGPRALGHRSILADPRSPDVRDRLNAQIKKREMFRPFAPAVLAERAAEWFDMDGASPYMLEVAAVASAKRHEVDHEPDEIVDRLAVVRSQIPACTHVDFSARVQTVDASTNPELHGLLTAFDALTGCPVLLNTSFNEAGEPIVATPDQALATARRCGFDLLVVEHHVIDLAADAEPVAVAGSAASV